MINIEISRVNINLGIRRIMKAAKRLPLSAPPTDKVQKKMSSAQGVGREGPDYPRDSAEAVSHSESAPKRKAEVNDYLP